MDFTYHLPTKICYGTPAIPALRSELNALAVEGVLFVSDPGLAEIGLVEQVLSELRDAGRQIHCYTDISSNPTSNEAMQGLGVALEMDAQAIVALGGGSVIDVAKAIAMLATNGGSYRDYQWGDAIVRRPSMPLLAIPTTAGTGSEVSKVAVIVDPERPFKKGVLSPLMYPHAAILDPSLTDTLPPLMTAATGIDAMTHALEAFIGRRANPYTDMLAISALETILWALPRAFSNGSDRQARAAMLLAATWAGTAMDHGGLGLIHSLSGPLTATCHLHHGLTNAILLTPVFRFNLPSIMPNKLDRLKTLFLGDANSSNADLSAAITRFVRNLGLPSDLKSLVGTTGIPDEILVIEDTLQMAMTPNNPREVSAADIEHILHALLR